jgi:3-dehydroquinate synthase
LPQAAYDIEVGSGLISNLETHLQRAGLTGPFLLVSQPRIFKALGKPLRKRFPVVLIPDGERAKSFSTVNRLLGHFSDLHMTRQSTVVALGGGVVGDVTGFAASMYMRGIAVVQVPTTLLAQVDSSIGGKTGINFKTVKNLVGAFHQPRLVLADIDALRTLPIREYRSGLYEALKYGIICDRPLFEDFEAKRELLLQRDGKTVERLVARCAAIKGDVVSRDEKEGDLRRVLNLGHTVGHGLEAAAGFRRLKHGEAVGLGMIAAVRISSALGRMPKEQAGRVETVIRSIGELPVLSGLKLASVMAAMQHDKKVKDGKVHLILPLEIGRVEITSAVPLEMLRETVKAIIDENKLRR